MDYAVLELFRSLRTIEKTHRTPASLSHRALSLIGSRTTRSVYISKREKKCTLCNFYIYHDNEMSNVSFYTHGGNASFLERAARNKAQVSLPYIYKYRMRASGESDNTRAVSREIRSSSKIDSRTTTI